jgi:hypothetical protein
MDSSAIGLRSEIEALCKKLHSLKDQYREKSIDFVDVERLWSSGYRAEARGLADMILGYVPEGDPRFVTLVRSGNWRAGYADVVTVIDEALAENTVVVHLDTITSQFSKLADLAA